MSLPPHTPISETTATTPSLTVRNGSACRRPGASPRLLTDTPLLDLLEMMRGDIARLRELAPNSDGRSTLEHYLTRLERALNDAAAGDVWVSADAAAELRGCTVENITYHCRKGRLRARKRGGVWEIHRDSILTDTRMAG